MSYTIDIYRGKIESTRRFLDFLLFVSFFPQLVAGPIERASHLLPQILKERKKDWPMVSNGFKLMLVGFFKKMVIADNMAMISNSIFSSTQVSLGMLMLGCYAFAFQIYGDFSGYTDIARGCARMLGFDICINFNSPYLAVNPSDFWKRWHISLSSWLKDYLYIPLGGNRRGPKRTYVNLMLTMLLGGLWHGAAWNFIFWGFYQGFLLCGFRLWSDDGSSKEFKKPSLEYLFRVFIFFQLTCIGWLIFRVPGMQNLGYMLASCTQLNPLYGLTFHTKEILLVAITGVSLFIFQLYVKFYASDEPWLKWPLGLRVAFYLLTIYGIIFLGARENVDFIYFQF